MRKTVYLVAMALALSSCSAINTATKSVTPSAMDAANKSAYTAKAGYAAALIVAGQYVKLTRCEAPAAPPLCSKQAVVDQIRKADLAADAATQAAENAVRNLGSDPLIVSAAVEAATQSVAAFTAINNTYKVK